MPLHLYHLPLPLSYTTPLTHPLPTLTPHNSRPQDPDAGENATVTYHFVASDGMNDLTSFTLDPKTGVVATKRHLDYETRRSYTLTVVARDGGGGGGGWLESPARLVRVEVQDVNDNQPVFVDHQQVRRALLCAGVACCVMPRCRVMSRCRKGRAMLDPE